MNSLSQFREKAKILLIKNAKNQHNLEWSRNFLTILATLFLAITGIINNFYHNLYLLVPLYSISCFFLLSALLIYILVFNITKEENDPSHYIIRKAKNNEANIIHNILIKSFSAQSIEEITSEEKFRNWLESQYVIFVIIDFCFEQKKYSRWFYSIHPLRVASYKKIADGQLDHDDISVDDLFQLSEIHDSKQICDEPCVLFILDLEVMPKIVAERRTIANRRAAAYLIVDLVETIMRITSKNNVEKIAMLAASKSGHHLAKNLFGFKTSRDYRPLFYEGWKLYEFSNKEISFKINKINEIKKWPDLSKYNYPYTVDENIKAAAKCLAEMKRLQKYTSMHEGA
jgi:hypothetical protein